MNWTVLVLHILFSFFIRLCMFFYCRINNY